MQKLQKFTVGCSISWEELQNGGSSTVLFPSMNWQISCSTCYHLPSDVLYVLETGLLTSCFTCFIQNQCTNQHVKMRLRRTRRWRQPQNQDFALTAVQLYSNQWQPGFETVTTHSPGAALSAQAISLSSVNILQQVICAKHHTLIPSSSTARIYHQSIEP